MSEPLNPVDVENSISEIANRIAKGVAVVSNAYAAYLDADRMYDRAFAQAYMAHQGPLSLLVPTAAALLAAANAAGDR